MRIISEKRLIEHVFDYDLILVGVGINNTLGNGYLHDIKINFPNVEKELKATNYGDRRKMGTVRVVETDGLIFCLCFIHNGSYRSDLNPNYLDIESLKTCIGLVNENFKDKKIAGTIMGAGPYDGNGDKEEVIKILSDIDNDVFDIYDYEQRDYREENNEEWAKIISKINSVTYDEMRKMKDDFIWKRKHGIYKKRK